jgi:hypothetical protein
MFGALPGVTRQYNMLEFPPGGNQTMRTAVAFPKYLPLHFVGGDDPEDARREPVRLDRMASGREDLPYKVELWDEARQAVEQLLAVTASGSIGYAAFYAATREYPNRYITLRHKNSIVSRWNAAGH